MVLAALTTLALLRYSGATKNFVRSAGLVLAAAISISLAGAAFHYYTHGTASPTSTGAYVFSRGVIAADTLPLDLDPDVLPHIVRLRDSVRPILRAGKGASVRMQARLQELYTVYVQYQLSENEPELHAALTSFAARNHQTPDQALAKIGLRLLSSNVGEYFRQSWINFVGIWTIIGPLDVGEYNRFMDRQYPTPRQYPLPLIQALDFKKTLPSPSLFQRARDAAQLDARVDNLPVVVCSFYSCPFFAARVNQVLTPGEWRGRMRLNPRKPQFSSIAFSNIAIERYFLNSWPAMFC